MITINILSNSRIALSVASILAAGALVAGATFAFFSDSASSNNNLFTSGTMDLKLDDIDETTPSATVSNSISTSTNFAPGESTSGFVSLHNSGTVDIAEVELGVDSSVTTNPDSTGDMSDVLNLTVIADDNTPDPVCSGGSDITTTIDSQVGNGVAPLALKEFDNGGVDIFDALFTGTGIAPGASKNICLTVTFDPNAGNQYQGDVVTTNFAFTANQNASQ